MAQVLQVLDEVGYDGPRTREVRVQQGYFREARSGEHDLLVAGIPFLKFLSVRETRVNWTSEIHRPATNDQCRTTAKKVGITWSRRRISVLTDANPPPLEPWSMV